MIQMNRKVVVIFAIVIVSVIISISFMLNPENKKQEISITPIDINYNSGGSKFLIGKASNLFHVSVYENDILNVGNGILDTQHNQIELDPNNTNIYEEIRIESNENVIFIIPIFTEIAYRDKGFYSYYKEECDSTCLEVPIETNIPLSYHSSENAVKTLHLLGYQYLTDIEVDKNPNILSKYKKVILLHNEYVTKNEFEAITNHPNVVYLYPNALYAKIEVDYNNNFIKLIQGHSYPEKNISNGFYWKYDNSADEYNVTCDSWRFIHIPNGNMLNCYPENFIYRDVSLLKEIRML